MKNFRYQKMVTKLGSVVIVVCLLALNSGSAIAEDLQREMPSITATMLQQASTILQLQQTDILFNGGFEVGDSIPLGWQKDAWTLSSSTFLWDTNRKHSGNKSVKIANSYNNDARWIQTVFVQPNSNYLLSGWIKTQIVAHTSGSVDAGANLSILGGFERTNGLFGTNDWTYVTLQFNTGSRTQIDVAARLGMYSGETTGIAWFDDLKLELLSTPACYTFTKNVVPFGIGAVSVDPLPNCNNGQQYVHGTIIKLTATPNTNANFISWSGDASDALNPIYVTMTANNSVTANFGYPLSVVQAGIGHGTVISSPAGINCGGDCSETFVGNTSVTLTATANIGSTFTGWSGACSGTGNCIVSMISAKSVTANFSQSSTQNPKWRILVLIYSSTDFTYSDNLGQHHVVASMSQNEIDRAVSASNLFTGVDIPALTSGNMIPLLTIRYPNHALSSLDSSCGYWPSRTNIMADLDPSFDSVIVIWDDTGTDLNTGQQADLNQCGGLAAPNGTGQTQSTFPIDSVASNDRNVFKHEWGHSILFYFEAAGLSPLPTVDNHINNTTNKYVHCPSGIPYILQDETDTNPIPNSIYNNQSGFTHDYYSGTTAKPENPTRCLGITPTAWSYGGPVTKPVTLNKDTVGVFRPGNGVIFLKNTNVSGFADISLNYGNPGDYPVVGDWDGDGDDTIGIYRNGVFYLRNSNTIGVADLQFAFGQPGDQPIAGDWDGDGDDTIGIYRPSTGQFQLRNINSAGAPFVTFNLGNPGDVGIAGDWDGDGDDTTGVFRPGNGVIYLKNTNASGFAELNLHYGNPGDKPVVGDWDGDGDTTIGIFRGVTFYLRNSNTVGIAHLQFNLGNPGDVPIAGNWDGLP